MKFDFFRPFGLMLVFLTIVLSPLLSYTETGQASWYGGKFQGRPTASGEIFDTHKLTAAHKTLAFGTEVEVTNLANNRQIRVRINDRGPFVEGRIIDLSRAAAEALDMIGAGVADVMIQVVEHPEQRPEHRAVPEEGTAILQIGSYGVRSNAKNIQSDLVKAGFDAQLENAAGGITRVIIPGVPLEELEAVLTRLENRGYSSPLVRRTM